MAQMNAERLARELQGGRLTSIYGLFGEETFLIDEALHAIVDSAIAGGPKDFNLDVFYAGSCQPNEIVDAGVMLPMMCPRRVVVIKETQNFKEKQLEALLPIVESPEETSVIIFTGSKVDQRKKLFKLIEKNGSLVKFPRADERVIPGWITQMVEKEGKRILADANQLLLQLVGPSLIDLRNEILKVIQFMGDKEIITTREVESVVSRTRMESVFELATAVGAGNRADAIVRLVQLLDQGENEIGVLAMISRHIRILMLSKEAISEGMSSNQVATQVGVSPYFVNQYIKQAQQWSRAQLERVHRILLDTDRALKSAPVASHILLENLVVKSCECFEATP
ncbi:MAG: DNA polymerase III subunit delta [Bdellovibrionales bacterium]|nr:DNA polymerase III subunit delta [Bdellovibrionales bacterium]